MEGRRGREKEENDEIEGGRGRQERYRGRERSEEVRVSMKE